MFLLEMYAVSMIDRTSDRKHVYKNESRKDKSQSTFA